MAFAAPEPSTIQEASEAVEHVQKLLLSLLEQKASDSLPDDPIDSEEGMALMEAIDDLVDLHSKGFRNTRDSKQNTANAKNVMDTAWLSLQNVMYEKRHLLDDIVNCRAFRSVYQDIDLVPLDEFRSRAPAEYLQSEDDPHMLLINRLKFEFDERTRLKEEQDRLEEERIKLIRENRKAQERIDRFDKMLDDFVEASRPLQDALDEERRREEELSAAVPMETDSKPSPSPPPPSSTTAPMETDD